MFVTALVLPVFPTLSLTYGGTMLICVHLGEAIGTRLVIPVVIRPTGEPLKAGRVSNTGHSPPLRRHFPIELQ